MRSRKEQLASDSRLIARYVKIPDSDSDSVDSVDSCSGISAPGRVTVAVSDEIAGDGF